MLNLLVALVVVAAVRAVGTVLVIALLIVPGRGRRLLSDRLAVIVPLAVVIGAAGGWLGLVVQLRGLRPPRAAAGLRRHGRARPYRLYLLAGARPGGPPPDRPAPGGGRPPGEAAAG